MPLKSQLSTLNFFLACVLLGCGPDATEPIADEAPKQRRTVPVRVLVIDDERLTEALERQWNARADDDINIRSGTSADVAELEHPRLGADVVIYPSSLLGSLASRELLSELERDELDDPELGWGEYFPLLRSGEVSWGGQVCGVSFGSPTLTLYYRADLFEELGLQAPATWGEYQELAARLSDRSVATGLGEDDAWFGTAEVLAPGWRAKMLLARAACYARHRGQFSTLFDGRTMEPLIGGPSFVRALTELVAAAEHGPADASPSEVRRLFAAGSCAMALSWPTRSDAEQGEARVRTGFAELPGSREVFNFRTAVWETRPEEQAGRVPLLGMAGRVGSVTRECRRRRAAVEALTFFAGLGDELASESEWTTVHRETQAESASRWVNRELDAEAARQYFVATQEAQGRTSWLNCLRIPGSDRYLEALDGAVERALAGESPETVLGEVATQWRELTAELGMAQQKRAYSQSIGRSL